MLKGQRQSLINSIFKDSERAIDQECMYLNKKSIHPCFYKKDKHHNIRKEFSAFVHFQWEAVVLEHLSTSSALEHFTPLTPFSINDNNQQINYNVKHCVSLRSLLNLRIHTHLILHELSGFVCQLNTTIVHANLHIDNVFFNVEKRSFIVIDLSNSFIVNNDNNMHPLFERTLAYTGPLETIDFTTLHQSLVSYFKAVKGGQRLIRYLDNLFSDHV
jgi:hypothetical protein